MSSSNADAPLPESPANPARADSALQPPPADAVPAPAAPTIDPASAAPVITALLTAATTTTEVASTGVPPPLAPAAEPPLLAPNPTIAVPPPAPPEPAGHPIVFHGKADEFFRIWIVNTLLTLLTAGVFFAWAKVRKRRYLRGSTELLGHRFDYRANPLRLLVGHVVVLCLVLGYSFFGVVYPTIRFGVIAIGVLLLPWIVVRSMTFNAHNTVYRGLRFRFNPSLSAALKVYLLEPLLIPLSLGLYYPAWQRSKRDYAINNHRFGDAYFRFEAKVGRFYTSYLAAGLILFAAIVIGSVTSVLIMRAAGGTQLTYVQLIPFFIVYGFGFFVSRHLIFARLFNHVWNHTRLDDHKFRATLVTGRWLGLQITNLGAIVISAGMLYPWALIRAQRYAASCLEFVPAGDVDNIHRIGGSSGSATGDMAAEFIGLDFGL
jgi:uncharacterized membrane protein YjgN (DUF898 family)